MYKIAKYNPSTWESQPDMLYLQRKQKTYWPWNMAQHHIYYLQLLCALEFFVGGVLLLRRTSGNRARRMLGYMFFINSLNIFLRTTSVPAGTFEQMKESFFSPLLIFVPMLITTVMVLYILEVIRPGWINWKRGFCLALPWLGSGLLYFFVLRITGEPIRKLTGMGELWAHIGEFNVWFRFVLLLVVTGYLFAINWFMARYRIYYEAWCARNFAEPESMSLAWMQRLVWGFILLNLIYYGVLFKVCGALYEVHQICFIAFFGCFIYGALIHKNPYPSLHFAHTLDEAEAEAAEPGIKVSEATFREQMPGYIRQVQTWMEQSQPYLRKDFQLMDVSEVVGLNRTYLSRIFNEGMGGTFSDVVQKYRIEKAKTMLLDTPEKSLKQIAMACGFSALSSFYHAFQKQTGMAPGQYRRSFDA